MSFKIIKASKKSQARLGSLKTAHGLIKTPFFMPIATRGSVKSLTATDMKALPAQIILSNTYHLYLKPGLEVLKKSGGLHKFMDWPGPILTDSGGYQVFSLGNGRKGNKSLVKISEKGVEFKSVYDGSRHLFTPKKVLEIQKTIGSDIRMVLDVCSPAKCSKKQAEKDLDITLKWARGAIKYKKLGGLLFGIVQGALYKDLRLKSAQSLLDIEKEFSATGRVASGWDGYAVGGLAVGESAKEMYRVLDYTVPALPADKAHYLMGVGYPEQIVQSVKRGIDMFDCVIPTREARHGRLYLRNKKYSLGNKNFYQAINIKSAKFAKDIKAVNPDSKILELRNYSKAYLRHLFSVSEPLAIRLATLNNLEFYLNLMAEIRSSIKNNKL